MNTTAATKAPQPYSIVCGRDLWSARCKMPAISAAMTPTSKAIAVSSARIVVLWDGDGVAKIAPSGQFPALTWLEGWPGAHGRACSDGRRGTEGAGGVPDLDAHGAERSPAVDRGWFKGQFARGGPDVGDPG